MIMENRKILLIFDNSVNVDKVISRIASNGARGVDLFPLTGDISILQRIEFGLHGKVAEDIFRYDTSAIIDGQVTHVRERLCKWSADIGDAKAGKKSVKEWFVLPSCNISAWWFGLLAERNPFKTDIFLRIAQVHAIEYALNKMKYNLILLSTGNGDFKKAIKNVAGKLSIRIETVAPVLRGGLWKRIKESVKNSGLWMEVLRGFKLFFNFLIRKYTAQLNLSKCESRIHNSDSILFVSYFPLIEKVAAQNGIFRNRYALALQEKLRESGLPITWILMYVPIDGFSFRDAVMVANRFVAKGEKLFFLEEFLSLQDIIFGLYLWVRQILVGLFLFRPLKKELVSNPVGKECLPFMQSLWRMSFYGPIGLEGILFALAFRNMARNIKNVNDCIYYFEMQPWEHALNSAIRQEKPGTRSIGFQHSSIPKNSFNYFYDRSQTMGTGNSADLPLPDIVGCNGKMMYDLLSESGFPALTRLEALRYLYFDEILSASINPVRKRHTLLIAGSGNKEESIRLIMLIRSVFPKAAAFDICFKGHPSFPFEKLFKDLGIDAKESGYIVNHDDISVPLKEAFAVVTLSSTVTIEALAFGCEVIVPVFPDSISLHPLVGFEKYYHKVTNKEEFANVVGKILSGYSLCDIQEYRSFVRKYWDIDKDIPRWLKLLNVRDSGATENNNTLLLRR